MIDSSLQAVLHLHYYFAGFILPEKSPYFDATFKGFVVSYPVRTWLFLCVLLIFCRIFFNKMHAWVILKASFGGSMVQGGALWLLLEFLCI